MSQIDLQAYLDLHRLLEEAIEGLDERQLTWKPSPASWSVTEVLTHLLDHHLVVSFRIRDILAGTTAKLAVFHQDQWVSGQKGNQSRAADILEAYRALLRYNSLLFQRLDEQEWAKTGVNFKDETVSVASVVTGFINHVHHHLGQIERIKKAQSISSVVNRSE
jgi:uncharacterized damage-inducible protein DinB